MHLFIVGMKHKTRLQFFSRFTHFHSIFFLHIFLLNTLLLLLVLMVRGNFKVRHARVTAKKNRQWSAREKLMIITYYEKGHSKYSTADKFGIQLKQLRDWLNNKEKLMRVAPYTQRLNIGAHPKYPLLEAELIDWFREARKQLKTITRYMIQAKARSLAKKISYQVNYPNIRNFKFSRKWVDGFMTRHKLFNRRRTTITQKLPEDYVE